VATEVEEEALGGWLVGLAQVVCVAGQAGSPRIKTSVRATA